ncbi:hypothetical protein HETIRDRAFT_418679 [Heterobasidion irregulare TC 32-1]|uniref:Altered inheritance of mitochondria protein 41 n=1 Tax=Heterobasidion irregulare (strain TC 32-1) TaxID=747525 RepID=W4K6L6_HETIT|nr:uncharacterized protein HETIRDRAFT_418679 [Heterobasidion irregulare TC 32-1]ETW80706.1 hypothetical protein HETIRDRAFT_418679 [Heterobasidion irregulare TC 32-1]
MYRLLSNISGPALRCTKQLQWRQYTASAIETDIRTRLLTGLKTSMKSKDTFASTTIRSILSEVYSADKASPESKIPSATIVSIIRKATNRRIDSAVQFTQAQRPDLAEKEQHEADFLSSFLPPLLPESDIDHILGEVISEQTADAQSHPGKLLGKVVKAFYSKVDKSNVDPTLVKRRAEALLSK